MAVLGWMRRADSGRCVPFLAGPRCLPGRPGWRLPGRPEQRRRSGHRLAFPDSLGPLALAASSTHSGSACSGSACTGSACSDLVAFGPTGAGRAGADVGGSGLTGSDEVGVAARAESEVEISSSARRARSGRPAPTVKPRFWPPATGAACNWPTSSEHERSRSPPSPPVSMDSPPRKPPASPQTRSDQQPRRSTPHTWSPSTKTPTTHSRRRCTTRPSRPRRGWLPCRRGTGSCRRISVTPNLGLWAPPRSSTSGMVASANRVVRSDNRSGRWASRR